MSASYKPLWLTIGALLLPGLVIAQSLRYSPDTTAVLGGITTADETVAEDDLAGGVIINNIGPLPAAADLTAYHLTVDGHHLMAFDTTVVLGGLTVEPGDVVRFDGAVYNLDFDASGEGVSASTYVDAVAENAGDLVLSFDTTVTLDGITLDDEDLVGFDGTNFTLFFDGSDDGVTQALDLDAAHVLENGILQLSFDSSGSIAGISFDDEDVLSYDATNDLWSLIYDGDTQHSGWAAADLDALGETAGSGGSCTPAPDPDLNDDGIVNILDISIVGSCFGQDPQVIAQCAVADTNCDGLVDFADLNFVNSGFGQSF